MKIKKPPSSELEQTCKQTSTPSQISSLGKSSEFSASTPRMKVRLQRLEADGPDAASPSSQMDKPSSPRERPVEKADPPCPLEATSSRVRVDRVVTGVVGAIASLGGTSVARKTSQVAAGKYGTHKRCRAVGSDDVVPHNWKPTECPRCFSEDVMLTKTKIGYKCFCDACEHSWEEIFSAFWHLR